MTVLRSVPLLVSLLLVQFQADAGFHESRTAFRQEIEKKKSFPIGGLENIKAILYDSDKGRFSFSVSQEEKSALMARLKEIFNIKEERYLEKIISSLSEGKIVVAREYRKGSAQFKGAQMHTCLLVPPIPCYERIATIERAEKTFAVYNASIAFDDENDNTAIGFFQPEGSFFGFTKAVNVPMKILRKPDERIANYIMPTQEEMNADLANMKPLSAQRTAPAEIFIDTLRTHPYFEEKKEDGSYRIDDEQILKILKILSNMSELAEVKDTQARWTVYEGFQNFYLVEYYLSSLVNIDAVFPDIPFLKSIVGNIAQAVSDEVSWKYLSLSMKNLRDALMSENVEKLDGKALPSPKK